MKLFALNGSREFGQLIAKTLDLSLSLHEERQFEDGEHKSRPLENVRNQEVFVILSLFGDPAQSVNDKLCQLLFFMGALKDASASKVTAIVPYLCYARKDRKTKSRDPVTTRYISQLFEASGADAVVTMDVHNIQAFQNAFRIPVENLEAKKIFIEYLEPIIRNEDVMIMSPDFGGIKRAEQFRQDLQNKTGRELGVIFMEKYRSSGEVWGERISGEVSDKTIIIIDDLISTGGTIAHAASVCKKSGANKVLALATHGIFAENANDMLKEEAIHRIFVTNTVIPFRLKTTQVLEKLKILNVASLFAETIKRMNEGGSVNDLIN